MAAILILAVILILSSPPKSAADLAESSEKSSFARFEWEVLTLKSFSSQIRIHPHILLMVTLPWSGEARSLRNKLSHLVTSKKELDLLRLMVIYKNTEKILADILHAKEEEITLFYFHFSTSYRYNGRLTPKNIMSSVNYAKSLKLNEVPFKTLQTEEDIESFFLSTDKAILLLDLCGWSAKLLHRNNGGKNGTSLSSQYLSENVNILGRIFGGEDQIVDGYYTGNHKQDMDEEQTCPIENGLSLSPWFQEYTTINRSAIGGKENLSSGDMFPCAAEDFSLFESFFMNFTAITREYLLPPERHKFGLISDESLLPFLGVDRPNGWSILLHYSGCSNCSVIVQEVDDLRNVLLTEHPLVVELTDGDNINPAFPASRPSIILFVDRSSDSPKVREDSKSSLEVLRKFALHNQIHQVGVDGTPGETLPSVWRAASSEASAYQAKRDFLNPKTIKHNDNLGFMIINEGESISLKNTYTQDNSVYDILSQLLEKKRLTLNDKETKISLVAKGAGFELLSDDFEVQVLDSLPTDGGSDQTKDSMNTVFVDHSSPLSVEENHVNMDNTGLSDDTEVMVMADEKEAGLGIDSLSEDHCDGSDVDVGDAILSIEGMKVNKYTSEKKEALKENKFDVEELELLSDHAKSATYFEKEPHFSGENGQMQQEKTIDGSSNVACLGPSPDVCSSSSKSASRDVTVSTRNSMEMRNSDELHYQHHLFPASFFFSDGGYQLLHTLTGDTKIPSLIIFDPVLKQHYALSAETNISYSSLVNFIDKYLNGSLVPYRCSASSVKVSRDMPRPPFVNTDFHEADSMPQVTSSTFCELVVGFKDCETSNEELFSKSNDLTSSWKTDVLVLFSSSGCGFCQRMELILREVYRAFKSFMNSSSSQTKDNDLKKMKEKDGDSLVNALPSILLMDCTHNDCGFILKPLGKRENYPMLLLFPAENKSAISYEGDLSVVNIMEFLESSTSHYLSKNKGILWTLRKESKNEKSLSVAVPQNFESATEKSEEIISQTAIATSKNPVESTSSFSFDYEGPLVVTGSILVATDKLNGAAFFDNSTILVVATDQNLGFQGVIINKPLNWNIFQRLGKYLESLKQAPLFYGGPVSHQKMPLVSLAQKYKLHYKKVLEDVYFGNEVATRLALDHINSGEESADEYWFFLGYSSWDYDQLYEELMEGTWQLSISPIKDLDWPKAKSSESE